MRWEKLFSREIIRRGRPYYDEGKVKGLKHRGANKNLCHGRL